MKPLLTLFSFLFSVGLFAQKMTLQGNVTDSTNAALSGATVVLMQQEDSVLVSFAITNEDGSFEIKKINKGGYILQISYLGYNAYSKAHIFEKSDIDVGIIKLEPQSQDLEEIIVKAEHIPIAINKDTIEYNAAAFQTQPNAAVEDLLKQLPGVEVDRNGNIKAQGENVDKVFVDGKEFFGDDPKIATQNLPADAIDKVQVFDRQSETAEFTGVDDGERSKTINLSLKEGKKKGYFGNVTAGYGTEDRFQFKGNLNRFNKKLQFSAITRFNNINEQGFSIEDYIQFMGGLQNMMSGGGGGFRLSMGGGATSMLNTDGGLQNGFVTSGAGGLNLNYDFSKKTELNLNYFYNYIKNENERTITRQNFLGNNESYNSSENAEELNTNHNHNVNYRFKHRIDSTSDLQVRGTVGFNDGTAVNSSYRQTDNMLGAIENSSQSAYTSTGDNFDFTTRLTYRKRFQKKGRAFVGDFNLGTQTDERNADLGSINTFYTDSLTTIFPLDQNQTSKNEQLDYRARLTFTEPLGKRKYLEFNYTHQNFSNESVKDFYDFINFQRIKNTQLSNHYIRDYQYNRAGLTFRLNKKKSNLTLGVAAQQSNLTGDILTQELPISKDFFNILPTLQWKYEFASSKNIRVNYRTSVREPSLEQLQPLVNNSDPLNIYIGNPDLAAEYSHTLNTHLMIFDQFNFTSFFAFVQATYTRNKITNASSIDSLFRQSVRPINVDNDLVLYGSLNFSTPLKFIKSTIRVSPNATYNKGILFVNGIENQTDRLNTSLNVTIDNRKKEIFDIAVGAIVGYNNTTYSVSNELNQDFFNQTYFADITLNFGKKKWSLSSSMDYTIYSQEAFGSEQVVPIWKASISRFFLKNQRGQLKLSAFDLLNQNVGINRTSNLNYIQDERITSLGRYYMLTFAYSLSGFGKKGMFSGINRRRR